MKFDFVWTADFQETFDEAIDRIFEKVKKAQRFEVEKFENIYPLQRRMISITNNLGNEIAKFMIDLYPNGEGEYIAEVESL